MEINYIKAQLQRRLHERQLSAVALASGVSRRTLYRIIDGKSNATMQTLGTLDTFLKRTERSKRLDDTNNNEGGK